MTSLKIVKGRELAEGVVAEVELPERPGRFTIGRDRANQWPIPDRSLAISGRHCEIVATPAGLALRDLSTNGTFVNGSAARMAGDHVLRDGDRFEIGPFVIMVNVPVARREAMPLPADAGLAPLPASPAAARPAFERPVRGGDPAAMLAAGARRAGTGMTEILRQLPPIETGADQVVTKIRAAPRPAAATPARDAAPVARAQAAVSAPTFAAPSPFAPVRGDSLRPLAQALGLAADAFDGRDPAEVLAQVGQLTRASVALLRQQLDAKADAQVRIGGRMPPRPGGHEVDPLRLAATPEAALRALLAPGADVQGALQRAASTLRG